MDRTGADYLAILRRRLTVVIATVVVFGVVATATQFVATPSYKATSVVFLAPIIDPISNTPLVSKRDTLVNMDTEQRLATSVSVAEKVRDTLALRNESGQGLLSHVSTEPVHDTELLRITYRDSDSAQAVERASAWAKSFLDVRLAELLADRNDVADGLRVRIEDVVAELTAISVELAALPAVSADRFSAEARREAAQQLLRSLQDALVAVTSVSTNVGKVVNAPGKATETQPYGAKDISAVLFAGLIIGLAIALVIDRSDQRIGTPEDVAFAGLVALGEFSRTATFDARSANRARSLIGDSASFQKPLLVVPIEDAEAAAIVANGLARSLAATGRRVAVVAADPDSDAVERLLGVPVKPGFSDAISSKQSLDQLATDIAVPVGAIAGVGSGTRLPIQASMLGNRDAQSMLVDVATRVDTLLIVCPPLSRSTSGLDLSSVADSCVVALSARGSTSSELAVGVAELKRVGIGAVGAVVVRRK